MFTEEDMKSVMEKYSLKDFLGVKAPDLVEKDAFYYDENGNGFLETFYKTNPEPERHENGDELYFTNEQGETFRVAKREDLVMTNQTRTAETEEDFQEIYNREFEARKIKDTAENHILHRKYLIEQVETLISLHEERTKPEERDVETIGLANRFLNFLEQKEEPGELDAQDKGSIKYDPMLFHQFGFEFFKYLYDEYIDIKPHGKQRRFMNVWKFFSTHDLPEYKLSGSREDYKNFIKENFNFTIRKEDPSPKYFDTERSKIDRLRDFFEKNYGRKHKHLKNT